MISGKTLVKGIGALTAATVVAAPLIAVNGFDLYEPPSNLDIVWSKPSDNDYEPDQTNYVLSQSHPHKALFFGGKEDRTVGDQLQNYMTVVYIVYSKEPASEIFSFEWLPERAERGQIRASTTRNKLKEEDVVVLWREWPGINKTQENVYEYALTTWTSPQTLGGTKYQFDFDFYYEDVGSLELDGSRNVTECPYDYILSQGGGSSGGVSRPGNSSEPSGGDDDSPSKPSSEGDYTSRPPGWKDPTVSNPESSSSPSWDESSDGGSNSDKYPWESSSPDLEMGPSGSGDYSQGSEGDTGEQGDTWTLPEYSSPDLLFTDDDLNIPAMPELNFPDVPIPDVPTPPLPDLPMPDAPILEYSPDNAGNWPPPFPGIG